MKTTTKNESETQEVGWNLARKIDQSGKKDDAVVVALDGVLGTGKTTFTKGFARGLGIKQDITSPTFVLMKVYELEDKNFDNLVHIDAYRLENHEDLKPLGIEEMLSNPENIILIEWSDRVKDIIPDEAIGINFNHISESKRSIQVNEKETSSN